MKAMPRPPAVTMACAFVGISALLLLLELIRALTDWGTVEMQEGLQPTLSALKDGGFDLTMGELLDILRWVGTGFVLLAVAGVVFAVYAVRGDRGSRIGTAVIAVILAVLVLSFGWMGVLQSVLLLTAAIALWTPDARTWFDAQNAPDEDGAPEPGLGESTPPEPPAPPADAPANPWAARRPQSVLAAGLVTVIGSALAGGFAALFLVVYAFARAEVVQGIEEGPFADWYQPGEIDDGLRTVFWASLVILPLALAGLAAGLSLLARLAVGRAATLALAWITAAVGIVMVPLGLLGTGAAIAVIVLLNRDESRAWTAGAR